ncbi:P-type DNA transfer protein VirB5 [Pseudomonas sp. Q1-7]|uniref:P-type DNA transfer protein VirB5 n=1 Tax=Pseudomonas sp. Q1-7 TaxID=3020843 RepID=UPI002300C7AD|nr:P-type DNA transfer protein VirB5 [Pseudomonas sp. Q1-7]
MKKTLRALALASAALSAAPLIQASGIPTIDVASIAQMVLDAQAQAQQALDALNTAKTGIAQAKAQYEHYKSIATGNDQLGAFLDDPALNRLLPMGDWSEMYDNVKDITGLRNKYGLISTDRDVQRRFDQLLAVAGALEDNYNASTARVKNAEKLRQKLDEVQTPQQKEDLNLRYQQEFLELQNQQLRLTNMQMLSEEKRRIDSNRTAQKIMERMESN